MMFTIDADIWVAAFDVNDRFRKLSVECLRATCAGVRVTRRFVRGASKVGQHCACDCRIPPVTRSSDAVYAATAQLQDAPLVTLDSELVTRAGALTPQECIKRIV